MILNYGRALLFAAKDQKMLLLASHTQQVQLRSRKRGPRLAPPTIPSVLLQRQKSGGYAGME
jgi:hypothetical protein